MTRAPEPNRRYSADEYLDFEGASLDERYEFREGFIVEMREGLATSGGMLRHCRILTNIIGEVGQALKGSDWRAYASGLRVTNPSRTLYTFPDLTVIRGRVDVETHQTAGETATNPQAIVEVLAPCTEEFDRGRKFELCREIPSLVLYVLVAQSEPCVDVRWRSRSGAWSCERYDAPSASAKLRPLEIELVLSEVYDGVAFG
jgi:Uma2 family endonuclease